MATELLRNGGISAGTEEKSILHSIDLTLVMCSPDGN